MCNCSICGNELSDDFVRVMLDESTEEIEGCPRCSNSQKLSNNYGKSKPWGQIGV